MLRHGSRCPLRRRSRHMRQRAAAAPLPPPPPPPSPPRQAGGRCRRCRVQVPPPIGLTCPSAPRQPDPCPQPELAARSRGKSERPPRLPAALFPTAPPLRLPALTTLPSPPRGLPHAGRRGESGAEHTGARSPRGPHLRQDGALAVAPGGPAAAGGRGAGRGRPWRAGRDGGSRMGPVPGRRGRRAPGR